MTVQERFNELMTYLSLGPVQLAKECELKDGRITDIVRGKVKKVAIEVADGITRKFPSVSKDWLLYGSGEMLVSDTPKEEKIPNYDARINELLTICTMQQQSIAQLHEDITELVSAIRTMIIRNHDNYGMVADESPEMRAYRRLAKYEESNQKETV